RVPTAAPGAAPGLAQAFDKAFGETARAMEEFAFHRALASIWEFVGAINRYVDTEQPWALAKQSESRARLDVVLYSLAESLRLLGIVLAPFVPDAAARIRAGVGQQGEPRLAEATWGRIAPGTPVTKVSGLFPRVDERKAASSAMVAVTKPVG